MGFNCSVPQCNTKWIRGKKGIKLHSFPKNKTLNTAWKIKIRSGKEPTSHSRVCSLHFTEEDYITTSMGQWKILKKDAVPSQNLPARLHDAPPKSKMRSIRALKRAKAAAAQSKDQVNVADHAVLESLHDEQSSSSCTIVGEVETVCEEITEGCETSVPNEDLVDSSHCGEMERRSVESNSMATQTSILMYQSQYVQYASLNDQEVKYFSGFTVSRFEVLFTFTNKDIAQNSILVLSPKDQLLLTLCKYRHNLDFKMLSFLFCITPPQASKIFNFWTDEIFKSLKSVDFWSLGTQSKDTYRAIIDCTEIPIDKSENPAFHQLTFSQYKNRPTFKSLVAIDESGSVIYCSDLYGGSTSDRQIVILSGFVELLKDGETVLADRGFEISDLLEKKNVALNIPPFLRGKKQLSEKETMETRKIANRRIHVERLIGLSKVNNILREPMPSYLWQIANKIAYNCTMLCNMKANIVKSVPRFFKKNS